MIIFMHVARKIILGILLAYDLDLHTFYEIDKRNEKHEEHNLRLLMNLYFYDGEFQKTIDCSNKLLELSKKTIDIYRVTHQKILSLFLLEKKEETLILIEQQRKMALKHKLKVPKAELYYDYIEHYLSGKYEGAILPMQEALKEKNIEVLNYIKLVANYFMLLAYKKMGDTEQMNVCAKEVLCADKNRHTFFSNNVTNVLDKDEQFTL